MWELDRIREVCALVILAISSYTDIKERNIYLMPLFIGVIGSAGLSVVGFLNSSADEAARQIFTWFVFPILAAGFVIMVMRMLKEVFGMGDGYLYASLILMNGVTASVRLLCFASVFAGIFGVLVLCTNIRRIAYKYNRKLPFAPFMMAGFIAALL